MRIVQLVWPSSAAALDRLHLWQRLFFLSRYDRFARDRGWDGGRQGRSGKGKLRGPGFRELGHQPFLGRRPLHRGLFQPRYRDLFLRQGTMGHAGRDQPAEQEQG